MGSIQQARVYSRSINSLGFGVGLYKAGDPCSDEYRGSGPNSEPETRAVQAAFNRYLANITSAISLHSYGQLWLTPWAYTHDASPHQSRVNAWGNRAIQAIEKVHGSRYKNTRASVGVFRTGMLPIKLNRIVLYHQCSKTNKYDIVPMQVVHPRISTMQVV